MVKRSRTTDSRAVATVSRVRKPARREWLMLIHQLPPEPGYVRVKVRRRLQKLGAVALKNSVYVLPPGDAHLEDFQWLASEIVGYGGTATICTATFVTGARDAELLAAFDDARVVKREPSVPAPPPASGGTWVTRKDVYADRMASAWLVRRFIDGRARFRFVDAHGHRPRRGEVRFDMYGGEYTHVGDRCTFETLLQRFDLEGDPALAAIGEVVHDLDLKDDKFERPETSGVAAVLHGITASTSDDRTRIDRAAVVFDSLYDRFHRAP